VSTDPTHASTATVPDPHGDAIALLQAQVAALTERLARLETTPAIEDRAPSAEPAAPPTSESAVSAQTTAPETDQGVTDEEVLAISAALAAYLGVRLRIRQIRLLSSSNWAQQGRVSIQASHRLNT
jgi:methylmalonyl-CoA carboxyltransferase 12S subunit